MFRNNKKWIFGVTDLNKVIKICFLLGTVAGQFAKENRVIRRNSSELDGYGIVGK